MKLKSSLHPSGSVTRTKHLRSEATPSEATPSEATPSEATPSYSLHKDREVLVASAKEAHKMLGNAGGQGWERYKQAELAVYDAKEKEWIGYERS